MERVLRFPATDRGDAQPLLRPAIAHVAAGGDDRMHLHPFGQRRLKGESAAADDVVVVGGERTASIRAAAFQARENVGDQRALGDFAFRRDGNR